MIQLGEFNDSCEAYDVFLWKEITRVLIPGPEVLNCFLSSACVLLQVVSSCVKLVEYHFK